MPLNVAPKWWAPVNASDGVEYVTNTDDETSNLYPAHPTPAGGATRTAAPSHAARRLGASTSGSIIYTQKLSFPTLTLANTWMTNVPTTVLETTSTAVVRTIPPEQFAPYFTSTDVTAVSSSASVTIPSTSEASSSHTGAIVGGVVGGILGAALLGFLIYYFCFREKKSPMTSTGKQAEAEESGFTVANPAATR